MPNGGAPAFDPSKPFEPVEAPAFDPTKPFTPADAPPDSGKFDAALRGVRAGATFNLGDEIEGARANAPTWMPELVGPLPARTMVGAAKTGYGYLTGDKGLTDPYEKARDEARKGDEAAKTNHPYIYAGSELAGAVPAMAALPELGAARGLAPAARGIAKFGARTLDAAVTGGEYGTHCPAPAKARTSPTARSTRRPASSAASSAAPAATRSARRRARSARAI
jgi:hypothetical protein